MYPGPECVEKTTPIGRADTALRRIAREAKPRFITKRTAPETCKELDALPKTSYLRDDRGEFQLRYVDWIRR